MENDIDYTAAIVALADATRCAAKAEHARAAYDEIWKGGWSQRSKQISVVRHAQIVSELQAVLTALGMTTLSVEDNSHAVSRTAILRTLDARAAIKGGE